MMKGLDILEYAGEGYHRVVDGPKWTVAALNYADRFDEKSITYLERHNLTDETFVLLAGKATLLIGEKAERVPLEPLKFYNVRAGVWHNIIVSRDARVLIAENSDTSKENSDYLNLKRQLQNPWTRLSQSRHYGEIRPFPTRLRQTRPRATEVLQLPLKERPTAPCLQGNG